MHVMIVPLIALACLFWLAAPVQAAPVAPHDLSVAAPEITAPEITMVRQRCGVGMKRKNGWQDKNGAWHGPCVPKH